MGVGIRDVSGDAASMSGFSRISSWGGKAASSVAEMEFGNGVGFSVLGFSVLASVSLEETVWSVVSDAIETVCTDCRF